MAWFTAVVGERAMNQLRLTTCQAENTFAFTRQLARFLQDGLDMPVFLVDDLPWEARYGAIDAGEIDIAWVCGWPFAYWETWTSAPLKPLVAPLMRGERYDKRPIYYSDVVVRAADRYQSFADLRGTRFAFNYAESQSGHNVVCQRLGANGWDQHFFAQTIQSGSHGGSIAAVRSGVADAAAIDSTYFDWLVAHYPERVANLRVIDQLGPSPMPPVVAGTAVPDELCQQIIDLLCGIHLEPSWQSALDEAVLSHFEPIQADDYLPIRRTYEQIELIHLTAE